MTKTAAVKQLHPVNGNAMDVPTDIEEKGTVAIAKALKPLLADVYALYLKTKNFHWHMTGPDFRAFHLMLDEHAAQLDLMTDAIAERARKLGQPTLHSIGEIAKNQRIRDNDQLYVEPMEMLAELCRDNQQLCGYLRETHEVCDKYKDLGSTSMIEVWIDETEKRTWFLAEIAGLR